MKRTLLAAALMVSLPTFAADKPYTKDEDKAAYSIGYLNGKATSQRLESLNVDAYSAGFRDAYAKTAPMMTEDEMKATLEAFKQKMGAEAMAKAEKEAVENKKKSADYLASNAKKEGVNATSTGLQYEVLTQGTGIKPKATDIVKVHYQGKLIDGTVFDSSIARGEPASFQLNQVIPGWTEALQLMPVGSKYRITLPAELAYGEQGAGATIPGNAALVFEVELLSIETPVAAETKPATKPKKR